MFTHAKRCGFIFFRNEIQGHDGRCSFMTSIAVRLFFASTTGAPVNALPFFKFHHGWGMACYYGFIQIDHVLFSIFLMRVLQVIIISSANKKKIKS